MARMILASSFISEVIRYPACKNLLKWLGQGAIRRKQAMPGAKSSNSPLRIVSLTSSVKQGMTHG